MNDTTRVYFAESVTANQRTRFTLEVLREAEGGYRLIQRRWNHQLDLIDQDSQLTAATKAELKAMPLGHKRLVRQLRQSAFWGDDAA